MEVKIKTGQVVQKFVETFVHKTKFKKVFQTSVKLGLTFIKFIESG
jgi:hypothetical protein